MIHDHAEGRNYVKGMVVEIENIKQGDASSLTLLYEYMQGYIDLLKAHINKENKVLFRMADKALSQDEHEGLLKDFAALEKSKYSKGQLDRFITGIEGLEAIYMTPNP